MKAIFAIALLPILAACGEREDFGTDDDSGLLADDIGDSFNPAGPVVNACASVYYTELAGSYDGQIDYTSNDETLSCTWEVDLQITSEYLRDPFARSVCDLSMNMISTSALTEGCRDVGLSGDISEPLEDATNRVVWSSPPWPIEADALLDIGLSDDDIFPIGKNGDTSFITFRFDGFGNVTYPESLDGDWSGVLVKQ